MKPKIWINITTPNENIFNGMPNGANSSIPLPKGYQELSQHRRNATNITLQRIKGIPPRN